MCHLVRLACLRHAASVHPEPGSNSQKYIHFVLFVFPSYSNNLDVLLSFQRSFLTLVLQRFFTLLFVKCVISIPHPNGHVNNFFQFFIFFLTFSQKKRFLLVFIAFITLFYDHSYLIYADI